MPLPSYINSIKLNVSSGTPPNVVTREQTITSASLGSNSILITDPQMISDFNNKPSGTIFTPSVVVSYQDGGSGYSLANNSVSNYVPKQVSPSLSLAALTKLTTDASFNLTPLVSTGGSSGAMTFTSSNPSVATVLGSIVTLVAAGTATITVNIEESSNKVYASKTITATLTVNKVVPSLSLANFTKSILDPSFNLTPLVSTNSSGLLSFTSSNTSVATVSGSTVTIVGGGTTTITVSLAETAIYTSKTTTATLTVTAPQWIQRGGDIDGESSMDNSGSSVSLSADGTIVAIGAPSNDGYLNLYSNAGHVRVYKYDATKTTAQTDQSLANFGPVGWNRLGGDIDGEVGFDYSGQSVSLSADGTIVAIGAPGNAGGAGHVRVYKYDATKTTAQTNQSLANYGPVGWNRLGGDIDGEAGYDYSGTSVSLSADGTIVAIGANGNDGNGNSAGHVRVYKYNANTNAWSQRGGDIDGEAADDNLGISVSLSADGTIVAIGAKYNNGVNGSYSGQVRVYKYDATKTNAQTNQSLSNYGPAGWNRLGGDIDGEAANDQSGVSVSVSPESTIDAMSAVYNAGVNGSNSGQVRVYKYDATKTIAQWDDQSLANYGPAGWNRLGGDIDGEAAQDQSGFSVSLSADGTIIAIGARFNNSSGQVRVYKYDATKTTAQWADQSLANYGPAGWKRLGADIADNIQGSKNGWSVSLSSDGTIVSSGGPYTGSDTGHARVYKYQ
jgi:hypothetical protein